MRRQIFMMSVCAFLSSCGGDKGGEGSKPADDGLIDVIIYVYAPDGFEDPARNIAAMTPDGSRKKTLYAPGAGTKLSRAALNSDGTKIVSGDYDLQLFDLTTGSVTMLKERSDDDFYADEAVWSPDGSKILCVNWAGAAGNLETIKPDGTAYTALTSKADYDLARPNYTPDGRTIVATDYSKKYIAHFDADDTNGAEIIQASGDGFVDCAYPVSDTKILYFSKSSDNRYSLCSAGMDGTGQTTLQVFDERYDLADYLSANKGGTMIAYYLVEDWTGDNIPTFVVRPLTGNVLGTPVFSSEGINGIRFKFGRIKKTIFDAAPDLTY